MKKIILFLVFSLITVNVYSQGATCTAATAFCGADGTTPSLIFPNATTGGGGAFACLGLTPRPAWFYFKVDQTGTLIFDIIQNTSFNAAGFPVGTPLDVDFAVWGPFASATGNCSNLINNCPGTTGCRNNTLFAGDYPRPAPGNLVDCSYDGSPVEKMTIAGATPGQYYLAMVTNYSGPAGFIKLEQRQPILPTYGSTDCDIVCGISLGPDRNECAGTSINITTTFALPITSGTAPYQWLLNGVPQPTYDNMQTISVSTAGTWSVRTTRAGGCYQVTDSMVLTYYAPIPVIQPTDIILCTSSAAPYIFPSINKDSQILGALPASDYDITYYTDPVAANNGFPSIPPASLTNYPISTSPVTIYVRIEDIGTGTGCYTVRQFNLIVATAPAGTFSYASPTYCTSVTTPQPIFTSGLTPSGNFTTIPSTGLTINSTTGEIIPSTSTSGNYIVNYDIGLTASCPAFNTSTTVTINPVLIPTINCGTSTTTSVIFNWAAVTGATGYNVSYQINPPSALVNIGAIGNVLTYSVTGLTPGDTVLITVTPTGPASSCFLPNTQSCIANNCTPPPAPIASVTSQPTCALAAGTITVSVPALGAGITYTLTGTAPIVAAVSNATGIFSGLASGNYNVTTTISGCTSSGAALTVNTQPVTPPAPTASVTLQPTCTVATGTITVSVPAAGAGITYTLIGTAPVVASVTNSTGIFSGLASGNYSVTTTLNSCTSIGIALTVNAQPVTPPAPTASVTSQPTCTVATGTITVSVPAAGAGVTYTLTGTAPVGAAVSNATGIFSGLASGNYSVTTTLNSCTSSGTALTVNAQPVTPSAPTASVTSQPTCTVATGTITVSVPAAGAGITYTVTGTAPVVAAVSNATGIFSGLASGNYSVTTTLNSCTSSGTVLTVNAVSVTPLPTVTTPIVYCLNDLANPLSATPTFGGTLLWYVTSTGGTGSAIAPTPLTTTIGNTNYYVSQDIGGCESLRAVITVNISEPPPTPVATPSEYFADLQTITVLPIGNYEYQIDNGAFQSSNVFTNVGAGLHTITIRNECDSKSTTAYIVDYPRYFTPNSDGYHDTWNIPELKGQANSKVLIFDRFGKLIKEIRPSGSGWNGTFNGKELPSTDYWFIVTYKDGNGITKEHKAHFSMKR
ncbi:T9SS type B sorting domain-containing protein [Flavobacterium sp.]|uniref:T9SS type B sorting domain-containing protein n=1 Tax=Flavobacterium sp. TaxID=239 RepID=UPI00375365F1